MTTFPVIGARAELDIDQYNRNVRDVIQSAGRVDDALDMIVNSALDAQGALNRIRGDVNVDVQVDDSGLRDAKRKRDDLSGSESVDVNVEDNEIRDARNLLEDIRNIQVITIGIDVVMGGVGAVTGGIGGILETINDQQQAAATVTARTGAAVEGIEPIIENLWRGAWGETSRVEIAEVVAALVNMGVPLSEVEDAAASAFSVAQLGGEDITTVMDAARVASAEWGISMTQALDGISVGFSSGLNVADDYLDSIIEFAGDFPGFDSFNEFLGQALQQGIRDTDKAADIMNEIGLRFNEILTGEGSTDAVNWVERLDLDGVIEVLRENGQTSGLEWYEAFITRINERLASGEISMEEAQAAFVAFGGTIGEDMGLEMFLGIETNINRIPDVFEGAAIEAGNILNNNIGTAWTTFTRTAQAELTAALDTAFDITGAINRARDAMLVFSAEIASGETFGGALEVALEIPGLEAFINDLSVAFNNLIIGLFEVAREIMRALGADISDIENTISRLGGEQFQFEIFTAENVDDVETAIRNAVNRGVPVDEISQGISDAVTARVEMGDVGIAQSIIDALSGVEVPISVLPEIEGGGSIFDALGGATSLAGAGLVEGMTVPLSVVMELTGQEDVISEVQSTIDTATSNAAAAASEAFGAGDIAGARAIATASGFDVLIDEVDNWITRADSVDRINSNMGEGFNDVLQIIDAGSFIINGATGEFRRVGEETENFGDTLDETERIITRSTASFNDQFIAAKAMADGTREAGDAASRTANFYAGLEAQLAGDLSAWDNYNKKASDALSILSALSGLSLPSVSDVAAAAAAVNAAGATGNTTNNTTNVTNNNQSAAEVNAANNASGARGR